MAKRRSSTATPTAATSEPVTAGRTRAAGPAAAGDTNSVTESGGRASPAPVIAESKQARIISLLRRAEGATIAELMAATGWMSHSVRGTLSAVVKRKLGLTLESRLEADRGRVYCISPPPPPKSPKGRRKAKPEGSDVSASSTAA